MSSLVGVLMSCREKAVNFEKMIWVSFCHFSLKRDKRKRRHIDDTEKTELGMIRFSHENEDTTLELMLMNFGCFRKGSFGLFCIESDPWEVQRTQAYKKNISVRLDIPTAVRLCLMRLIVIAKLSTKIWNYLFIWQNRVATIQPPEYQT